MGGYLDYLSGLSRKGAIPIFCAGDIFDRWNSPPELINFAIKHLPTMYAVPGQHDLPLHNYQDIKKSAYWTLVEAGKVIDLKPYKPISVWPTGAKQPISVVGFPWGAQLKPFVSVERNGQPLTKAAKKLAVVHSYCWIDGNSYPGAPENKTAKEQMRQLAGFDVAVFGDNHKGFLVGTGDATAFNCGGFMRRKFDELDYKPQVGFMLETGQVVPHYLDTSKDEFHDSDKLDLPEGTDPNFAQALVKVVNSWKSYYLDFGEAIRAAMDRYQTEVEEDAGLKKAVQMVLDHVNTDKQGTGK